MRDREVRNTIARPRAMMIHLRDASFAHFAVMSAGWLDSIAFSAISSSLPLPVGIEVILFVT